MQRKNKALLSVGPRATQILRAARALFIREGGPGFSARGVAKEAQVSLGSVQYIFTTKDRLLAAMLEFVLADYERMYASVTAELPFNGEVRLLGVVDHLVADLWRVDTRKFFFNFWALGCHNPFAGKLVDATYQHHRRRMAAYIGAARPSLSEQSCLDIALQVAALLDGFMLYTRPGGKHVKQKRLAQMARQAVLGLLDAEPESETARRRAPTTS